MMEIETEVGIEMEMEIETEIEIKMDTPHLSYGNYYKYSTIDIKHKTLNIYLTE